MFEVQVLEQLGLRGWEIEEKLTSHEATIIPQPEESESFKSRMLPTSGTMTRSITTAERFLGKR